MSSRELEMKIWNACDVLRRDDNTKLITKYIEHLSWLLFLKAFDALERERELVNPTYGPVLDNSHRWAVWTTEDMSADELIKFVVDDLLPFLRELSGTPERNLVSEVFQGVSAITKSGFNLKDVITLIDNVDFHSNADVHTVSVVYESLLARLGEAGASGEYYTPRPIVRLMVKMVDPQIDSTVYDPACGSAGFLVESYLHMVEQERTTTDHEQLQSRTFFGQENGELPFILGVMNMILHGMTAPNVRRANTLERDIRTLGPDDQYDVVLTNPPFGGKENRQVQQNFPIRSSATEILFMQHVIASLKATGRCGIVVPDGVLFDDDNAFREMRRTLITECNLHTVVRLPPGSFIYTPHQRLNLLFFDRMGPTETIWFYEHPVPESRRHLKHPRYTKTHPLRYEDFEPLMRWWDKRTENEWAWRVSVGQLDRERVVLDLRHPSRPADEVLPSPGALADEAKDSMEELTAYVEGLTGSQGSLVTPDNSESEVLTLDEAGVAINPENRDPGKDPDSAFTYIDLSSVDRGIVTPGQPILGSKAPSRARRVVRASDVLFATVRPYLRGHAVVPADLDGAIASTGFAVLRTPDSIDPNYLLISLMSPTVIRQCMDAMRGAHYPAMTVDHVKAIRIRLPRSLDHQRVLADSIWPQLMLLRNSRVALGDQLTDLLDALKDSEFSLLSGELFDIR